MPRSPQHRNEELTKILTKEFIMNEAVGCGKTYGQIAKDLRCSPNRVRFAAKQHGIYEQVLEMHYSKNYNVIQPGMQCGRLTVIAPVSHNSQQVIKWMCRCDCGRIKDITTKTLVKGVVRNCGYCQKKFGGGHEDIRIGFWNSIERRAQSIGIPFTITIEDIWNLYIQQGMVCALSGVPIRFCRELKEQTASIDRIDSTLGYEMCNVQLIHQRIQRIKNIVHQTEFLYWCKLIYIQHRDECDTIDIDITNINYCSKACPVIQKDSDIRN